MNDGGGLGHVSSDCHSQQLSRCESCEGAMKSHEIDHLLQEINAGSLRRVALSSRLTLESYKQVQEPIVNSFTHGSFGRGK
jgi:hypothetical protein